MDIAYKEELHALVKELNENQHSSLIASVGTLDGGTVFEPIELTVDNDTLNVVKRIVLENIKVWEDSKDYVALNMQFTERGVNLIITIL